MFGIELKPEAIEHLSKIKRYYAVQIVNAIKRHLKDTPDKPSPPRIKILRGRQRTTYRLREGDYRIFYDVVGGTATVVAILHKSEAEKFYLKKEGMP